MIIIKISNDYDDLNWKMIKIDLKKMKIDNENDNDNENKNEKYLNIYDLKIYIVLKVFAEKES